MASEYCLGGSDRHLAGRLRRVAPVQVEAHEPRRKRSASSNKELKLTKHEHTGASQLNSSVGQTIVEGRDD